MNVAIIVAAGSGERFGATKQYLKLGNISILEHSIRAFDSNPKIDKIIVMISKDHEKSFRNLAIECKKFIGAFYGGATRQESVCNGLLAIEHLNPSKVLIHDAARPFATSKTITNVLATLDSYDAADLYVDVVDTLKMKEDFSTTDRGKYYITQTPQGFRYKELFDAHKKYAAQNHTDDITIAKLAGMSIGLVRGERTNFKITTMEDYIMAKSQIQESVLLVGTGFDTHALKVSDSGYITLAGERLAANYDVIAHSDGDVILHALMDAMLGAVGQGDIGEHFPPSDDKWKGASSMDMLAIVNEKLLGMGAEVQNIDITYLGEIPRISPHKEKMKNNIATALNLDKNRINVKATTAEGLGYIGRVDGVAAMASCTVKMKV